MAEMNKRTVLIVTGNKYPNGDAGSVRQHAFAKIFSNIGLKPIIIGMGDTTYFKEETYDNINYFSLRYPGENVFLRYWGRKKFHRNLIKMIRTIGIDTIDSILVVSSNRKVIEYTKCLARKYSIHLYYDSVEWYSPSEFKNGEKSREYINNNLLNSTWIDNRFKVFSISRFLNTHFNNKGIKSIRIPVILDVKNTPYNKQKVDKRTTFLYAGAMGGKDRLDIFIKALVSLPEEMKKKCVLHVLGIKYEDYIKVYEDIDSNLLGSIIIFHGRVKRDRVFDSLSNADFTVLLRPENERYAKAGFPTKVVESLASGTPVFCNLTSDLGEYLEDSKNAIIVNGCDIDSCRDGIYRVIIMSEQEQQLMKAQARLLAEAAFDWRHYIEAVREFVSNNS